MDLNLLISISAFLGVSALVGGLLTLFRADDDHRLENRLDQFTTARATGKGDGASATVLSSPLDAVPGFFDAILTRFSRLRLIFDQADTPLKPGHFVAISGVLALAGLMASVYGGVEVIFAPLIALGSATLPFMWLLFKRRQRLKKFAAQLPDALELISRALRAGHSLGAGFNLVNDEMAQPIAREFGRVFEEQNLGIPLEDALESLTDRVPNLDLRFFATAVILQRQTGGDLAEILDKIGYIIRERFKIWGQVQALTGEGRLSGAVLLGLPPALFLAVYRMNREYIMMLFTDPMGKQMLAGAIVMQILGALVIRKIINIKVESAVILADLITAEQIVPLAVFGMIAAGAWWLLEFLSQKRGRDLERLEEMKDPGLRRRKAEESAKNAKKDAVTRVLEKASPALAKPLQPKSELEASRLKAKLATAGFRGDAAASIFLGMKFAGLLVGLFLSGITIAAVSQFNQQSLMYAVAVAGGLFYLPEIALFFISRKRREAIFLGLPDALDLMVVCVEAGLGLDQAMRKVADEMKKTYPIIAGEFGLANFQLQMGRNKADVLHELGLRSGVDDLRALAAILIQADKFGSSIAQALRVQSDSMRTRRRQLAEEKAAKTAVKLIFPLVIFIFPGIFVVLVGPAAITMVRQMFPMMEGK